MHPNLARTLWGRDQDAITADTPTLTHKKIQADTWGESPSASTDTRAESSFTAKLYWGSPAHKTHKNHGCDRNTERITYVSVYMLKTRILIKSIIKKKTYFTQILNEKRH